MRVLVGAGVIAGHAQPQISGVKDVEVHIVVHARRPLAAEELAVGGISLGFEALRRTGQCLLVHRVTLLYPHVQVRSYVAQPGGDRELLVSVQISHPENLSISYLVTGRLRVDHFGDRFRRMLEARGQLAQIPLRDDRRGDQFLRSLLVAHGSRYRRVNDVRDDGWGRDLRHIRCEYHRPATHRTQRGQAAA